jgi:hypothetical protein
MANLEPVTAADVQLMQARGLFYSVGFREFTRDAPLVKDTTAS